MTDAASGGNGSVSRLLACVILLLFPSDALAQQPAVRPVFEAATIRASGDCTGGGQPQPARLSLKCVTASALIQMAYGYFANGVSYSPNILHFRGEPGWASSEHYDISAAATGNPSQAVMRGPMLQALLEDRFHLRFRRDNEDGQVYFLTLARCSVRLEKTPQGSCAPGQGAEPCGTQVKKKNGRVLAVTVHGTSTSDLADGVLSELANRTVINKTGLSGLFDFHLDYSPELETSPQDAPTLFTALQEQSGLKLTPGRGPVPVFVITHLEKPSGN
jgi:uncharacterized protein (TIGR03435 family)